MSNKFCFKYRHRPQLLMTQSKAHDCLTRVSTKLQTLLTSCASSYWSGCFKFFISIWQDLDQEDQAPFQQVSGRRLHNCMACHTAGSAQPTDAPPCTKGALLRATYGDASGYGPLHPLEELSLKYQDISQAELLKDCRDWLYPDAGRVASVRRGWTSC